MNVLTENKDIFEISCGANFAYILNDNSMFSSTEYKVLQSQMNGCFVKCMKMLFNGKIQLYYITSSYKPLSSMLSALEPDSLFIIITNLINDILNVKSNGFLSVENIDIDFEHIYIDNATYKVDLVYLPVNKKMYSDSLVFENELRSKIIKLISDNPNLKTPKLLNLVGDLSNGKLTLENLLNRIKGIKNGAKPLLQKEKPASSKYIRIIAMNAPQKLEISITKDSFIIGKKKEIVDGVISFNNKISRCHCKIDKKGNNYTITDLQSANGTYVNMIRIHPNVPYPINNGDIIRLANSDFQVKFF